MIITDESHRRHKEMQPVHYVYDDSKEQETKPEFMKNDFVLALNEEDFKAKELEMNADPARVVPKMPDFDMKMMPTFRDLPDDSAEDKKTDEMIQEEFTLAGQKWTTANWWRQMDPNDENLMYQLGMFAANAKPDNPIFQSSLRRHP